MNRFLIYEVFSLLFLCASLLSATGDVTFYQTTPTTDPSIRCYNFDSRSIKNGSCPLRTFCFAFIRRGMDGSFRVKRGCSSSCDEEHRNRKIKICCNSHLCNNQFLSASNFTMAPPCDPTTGSCVGIKTSPISQTSTTTPIIPPDIRPGTQSMGGFPSDTPTNMDHYSYRTCNCNQCGGRDECVGRLCGTSFRMSSEEVIFDTFCVNDTSRCASVTIQITCCDITTCNGNIQRDTTTTGSVQVVTTRPHTSDLRGSTGTTVAERSPATVVASQSSQRYFTLATVVSAVAGLIVIGITLVIIITLMAYYKISLKRKLMRPSSLSPSTMDKINGTKISSSPSPSCSTASTSDSSSNSCTQTDLLNTSV